jgi:hypothetical protein
MMDDDYERCGVTGPRGIRCTMPAGHGGKDHGMQLEIPPDVGHLIEAHLARAEAAHVAYNRERKRLRTASWMLMGAIALNVLVTIVNVFLVAF